MSLTGRSTHSLGTASRETISDALPPKISCQEDMVRLFFHQMLDCIFVDYINIEIEDTGDSGKKRSGDKLLVKDYKDLKSDDLALLEVASIDGSKVSLRGRQRSKSVEKKLLSPLKLLKKISKSSVSSKGKSLERLHSKNSVKTSSSLSEKSSEQFLDRAEEDVRIIFKSGDIYEGHVVNRMMDGKGKYHWANGTIYHGDFKDGFPTGSGEMVLPDLSRYEGQFAYGLFHGNGTLNVVATPTFYCGQWKLGKKHGRGWLLYEPNNWYDGEWCEDLRHGRGLRSYKNGAKYKGEWFEGFPQGQGTMIWENNDYYKGEWLHGAMDGFGEYTWKAFFNKTFAFPIQNYYRGYWVAGKRCGRGTMHFGADSGVKLHGYWQQDFKHGEGELFCGNGKVLRKEELFQCDKQSSESDSENVSIFTVAELVDAGFYIDKILERVDGVNEEKLAMLKTFEQRNLMNALILYLPNLREIYEKYAKLKVREELPFQPVMIRMFLWQFYRDIDIASLGLSLVDADKVLANHPGSCLDSVHHPFQTIYFWQFLMSLIGVAITTSSLNKPLDTLAHGGISAFIVKQFFEDMIFGKTLPPDQESLLFRHMDLAPIQNVYSLYKQLGEPHTAKCFLRHTAMRKGEEPPCYIDILQGKEYFESGKNYVPFAEKVAFVGDGAAMDHQDSKWRHINDLRRLGAKSIVKCLASVCPNIMAEGVVVNMDYPLTFIEFYETLLTCVLLIIERQLNREKQQVVAEALEMKRLSCKNRQLSKTVRSIKSDIQSLKKGRKSKTQFA